MKIEIEKDSLFEAPLLLWLVSPALGLMVAAPLVAGKIAERMLTARMRRTRAPIAAGPRRSRTAPAHTLSDPNRSFEQIVRPPS